MAGDDHDNDQQLQISSPTEYIASVKTHGLGVQRDLL